MRNMLRADFARLQKSFAFHVSLVGMLLMAAVFMRIQASAMDYSVPLSRVIFLPMSMYGIAMAAFVSVFVGTDFSNGFSRNKLIVAKKRGSLVLSQIVVSCGGCLIVYSAVTAFSAGVGSFFFENNVDASTFVHFFILGMGMSVATGCLFTVLTVLCGSKTRAIVLCMGLAFGMLFLCLHTNAVLVQTEYKNSTLNPHYVGGIRRWICGILHDLNPCGQAAQLSAWEVWHPTRALIMSLAMAAGSSALGCLLFYKQDVR